jgi:hypothetical protein
MKPSLDPQSTAPIFTARGVKPLTRLLLFVRAGGHCEFDGCNRYLLEHHVTLTEGVFAEMAHIVAFKPDGPRGRSGARPVDISDVRNLMLLCPTCHKLIDDHPGDYTREALEKYKTSHEKRIRHVTALGPDRKTEVLILKAPIRGDTVAVPFDQVVDATAPRYPSSREGTIIDLTSISDEDTAFIRAAKDTIARDVERFLGASGQGHKADHVSIFALAPMPLLVFLGRQLSNKIPSDVYQRHRDTEDWTWKRSGPPVKYVLKRRRSGRGNIALILSLSGAVPLNALPKGRSGTVYEITLQGATPKPTYLRTRRDLESFRLVYQEALGTIIQNHGLVKSIDLFPAVPAPVAVLCGRELLPKVHPRLRVYDYDKTKDGFKFTLEV